MDFSIRRVLKQYGRSAASDGSLFAVFLAPGIALERVYHDGQTQNDQQNGNDELEAVGNEHRAPGGLAGGNGHGSGG